MSEIPYGHYFQAVIFDLFGTLVDIFKVSEYKKNLSDITEALGLEPGRFAAAWKDTWDAFPYGNYPSVQARFALALELYHDSAAYPRPGGLQKAITIRDDYIRGQAFKIKDGTIDSIKWAIREGYKVGMVSNCSMETALSWKQSPLAKFIPDPTFSCLVQLKKPDPKIFLNETNKLKVDPSRCIYVADGDDHEFDTVRQLGMTTILVKYNTDDAYRHEPFPDNEHSITHFRELPAVVAKLEGATRA